MIAPLLALTAALRKNGVSVSTSEVIDATRALLLIDPADRVAVHSAVAACLIKSEVDRDFFDALFNLAFPDAAGSTELETHLTEAFGQVDIDEQSFLVAVRAAVSQLGGLDGERYFGAEYHTERVLRRLHEAGALALAEPTELFGSPPGESVRLRNAVVREVRRQAPPAKVVDEARRRSPEQLEFLRTTPADERRLRAAADAMTRKLASRRRRIRHHKSDGVLAARATVRRSLSTGGVPFDPAFRPRRRRAPEMVVLADVSGSVAGFSKFTLHVMNALVQAGQSSGNVRTFVFVDEVDEISVYFRRGLDIRAAIASIDAGAQPRGDRGHSDYGRVFTRFQQAYGDALSSSATLLILGDARNNYHEPHQAALTAMTRRVRKSYWLNPEPRSHWDTADSVAGTYESSCTGMFECRTVAQLGKAIDQIA